MQKGLLPTPPPLKLLFLFQQAIACPNVTAGNQAAPFYISKLQSKSAYYGSPAACPRKALTVLAVQHSAPQRPVYITHGSRCTPQTQHPVSYSKRLPGIAGEPFTYFFKQWENAKSSQLSSPHVALHTSTMARASISGVMGKSARRRKSSGLSMSSRRSGRRSQSSSGSKVPMRKSAALSHM